MGADNLLRAAKLALGSMASDPIDEEAQESLASFLQVAMGMDRKDQVAEAEKEGEGTRKIT